MNRLIISVNGKKYEVEIEIPEGEEFTLPTTMQSTAPHREAPIAPKMQRPRVESAARASSNASGDILKSPLNGVILEVCVKPGQSVQEGDIVFVLEAMKMKTNVSSAKDGVIEDILVAVGETVESGKPMLKYS